MWKGIRCSLVVLSEMWKQIMNINLENLCGFIFLIYGIFMQNTWFFYGGLLLMMFSLVYQMINVLRGLIHLMKFVKIKK